MTAADASDGGGSPEPAAESGGVEEAQVITTEIPPLLAGVRVDRGVAMVANVSRAAAAELVAGGRVELDGAVVTAGRVQLPVGAVLTVHLSGGDAGALVPEPGVSFEVVHADDMVVVVDKPAGLVVHPGAGHGAGTLAGGLLARFPDLADLVASGVCPADRPGIVHRLDKGTSGLLAVARTVEAYRSLTRQLAERTMERRYVALVRGLVADDRGEVEAPIGRSTHTPTKMAVTSGGKPARTAYWVRQRFPGSDPATLLDLALRSGRTHQIRVHMAAIGHPVVGDARYGMADRQLGSGRFFLHAGSLTFTHPGTGERVTFSAPLPGDLEAYLTRLS